MKVYHKIGDTPSVECMQIRLRGGNILVQGDKAVEIIDDGKRLPKAYGKARKSIIATDAFTVEMWHKPLHEHPTRIIHCAPTESFCETGCKCAVIQEYKSHIVIVFADEWVVVRQSEKNDYYEKTRIKESDK